MADGDMARRPPSEVELKRIVATGDPLETYYREMVGKATRLHVKLTDPVALRGYAAALRVLAGTLERLSHSKEPAHVVMMQARNAVEATNRAIGGSAHKRHPDRW
jgi:hypothetical protein